MKTIRLVMMLLAAFACVSMAVAGSVYRWTDERGHVNFSDRPQEGAQKIEIDSDTPSQAATPNSQDKPADQAAANANSADPAPPVIQADADQRGVREKNCDMARQALERNEGLRRMYRIDANGDRVYLTDDEREQVLQRSREDVKAWCD